MYKVANYVAKPENLKPKLRIKVVWSVCDEMKYFNENCCKMFIQNFPRATPLTKNFMWNI